MSDERLVLLAHWAFVGLVASIFGFAVWLVLRQGRERRRQKKLAEFRRTLREQGW